MGIICAKVLRIMISSDSYPRLLFKISLMMVVVYALDALVYRVFLDGLH